jgi:hypothetical protein
MSSAQRVAPSFTSPSILKALEAERTAAARGAAFKVLGARQVGKLMVLELEPQREGRNSSALDETWEGASAVWSGGIAAAAMWW